MDSLCARARSTMNLILLLGVLQAWMLFSARASVADRLDDLRD
jgi:hypothetical protein